MQVLFMKPYGKVNKQAVLLVIYIAQMLQEASITNAKYWPIPWTQIFEHTVDSKAVSVL